MSLSFIYYFNPQRIQYIKHENVQQVVKSSIWLSYLLMFNLGYSVTVQIIPWQGMYRGSFILAPENEEIGLQ